jgi:uncharacterized membrane protein HdeD (DUF308 family)
MTTDAMSFETQRSPWWLTLMGGILSIIVGILLLTSPAKTVFTLVVALGVYWIISGIITLVGMFVDHTAWGWKLFIGLISILAGILILRYPIMATIEVPQVIVLLAAFQSLLIGVILLIMAFQGGGWGSGILGVLALLFGAILLMNYWKLAAVVGLIWFVAILAIIGGIAQLIFAFQQRTE